MRIIGTGSALPELVVNNDMLAEFLNTSDEWISTRTGIKTRKILSEETLEELAAEAAKKALENAGVAPDELDFIICSNVYNTYLTPGLGSIIQGMIGAQCPCVDINGACAGFIFALHIAKGYLSLGMQNVLVVCAEGMSKMVDWTDRATCVLFGDGAGAAVLTEDDTPVSFKLATESKKEFLYGINPPGNCPYTKHEPERRPIYMAGQEVFRFAVGQASEQIKDLLKSNGVQTDEVSYYLLHQANLRILQAMRTRLNIPEEKLPYNIDHCGNTSSASIPLLLDECNQKGMLKKGDLIVMSAFGAGMVTGSCLIRWMV
ncbi:MAG: beta-ketoacyl-ACP synthase III [Christensenellales bacterium]|jgi:3-oxoacyl-[acyl-carrier-protein] synthase-3